MRELTERQQDVLTFIGAFTVQHGMPPTVREIGERFRVTPRAAFDHLRALERKGALKRRESAGRTSRALTLVGPRKRANSDECRSWGASPPARRCWPRSTATESCRRAASALPGPAEDFFALRVRGDSMIGAHICDGDLVIVESRTRPSRTTSSWPCWETGAEPEATVKRFVPDGSQSSSSPRIRHWGRSSSTCGSRAARDPRQGIGVVRGF